MQCGLTVQADGCRGPNGMLVQAYRQRSPLVGDSLVYSASRRYATHQTDPQISCRSLDGQRVTSARV